MTYICCYFSSSFIAYSRSIAGCGPTFVFHVFLSWTLSRQSCRYFPISFLQLFFGRCVTLFRSGLHIDPLPALRPQYITIYFVSLSLIIYWRWLLFYKTFFNRSDFKENRFISWIFDSFYNHFKIYSTVKKSLSLNHWRRVTLIGLTYVQ